MIMHPPRQFLPIAFIVMIVPKLWQKYASSCAYMSVFIAAVPYMMRIVSFVGCTIEFILVAKVVYFTRPIGRPD